MMRLRGLVCSALDDRSLPPEFESRRGHIRWNPGQNLTEQTLPGHNSAVQNTTGRNPSK